MPGIMTESIMGNLITVMAVIPTTGLITALIHTIGHIIGALVSAKNLGAFPLHMVKWF
jgi:hypothetical protein